MAEESCPKSSCHWINLMLHNPILNQLPGLAAITISGADLRAEKAVRGFSKLPDFSATPKTVWKIGSISKPITAILILKLLEQGKIATLDTPVLCLLKSVRLTGPYASNLTVRHLLTHTGALETFRSVGDFLSDTQGIGAPVSEPIPSVAQYYAPEGVRVDRVPGTSWMYSNHGYALLGQIIEDVSGMPLDQYAHDNLFGPLGMTSTSFVRKNDDAEIRLASGYQLGRKGALTPVEDLEVILQGAGSIHSTIEDLGCFIRMLLADGAPVLDRSSFSELSRLHYSLSPRLAGVGVGFGVDPAFQYCLNQTPTLMIGHTGAWPGSSAALMVFPRLKCGFAICSNMMAPSALLVLAKMIMRHLFEKSLIPRKNPVVLSSRVEWVSGAYGLVGAPAVKKMEILINHGPFLKVKVGYNLSGDPQLILSSWWGAYKSPILTSTFDIVSSDCIVAHFDFPTESLLPIRVEFKRESRGIFMLFGMDTYQRQ